MERKSNYAIFDLIKKKKALPINKIISKNKIQNGVCFPHKAYKKPPKGYPTERN